MKLLCIICESMTMDDVLGQSISGHVLIPFNPAPATFSAQSLWLMQTDITLPPPAANPFVGDSWFKDQDMIGKRFKTRICSNFWPRRYDPIPIDPEVAKKEGNVVGMEPNNHQWKTFMSYLDGPKPHEWLVYWPTMGHCGYRIGEENKGIPIHIRETTKAWLDMVRGQILPKTKQYRTIIFLDHGSVRKDKTREQNFENGFAWVDDHIPLNGLCKLNWTTMRALIEGTLCS